VTRRSFGLTFDTGGLIALERRTLRIWEVYQFKPLRPPNEVRGGMGAQDRVAARVEEDIR
jgi:hypothetical protein